MSSDSTSRRKVNFQSHHIHLKVPIGRDKNGNPILSDRFTTRFLGVHSTTDHSTATSHATWMKVYNDVIATYNASPLGHRTGALNLRVICRRLRGMCGDHANNEKALSEEMRQTKYDELLSELGEQRLRNVESDMSLVEGTMTEWNAKKIADAGGIEKWNELPAADQAARDLATTTAMVQALGMEELASMDEGERNLLTRTGRRSAPKQPIPLANKDTAKAVQKILHPEKGDAPVTDNDVKRLEDIAFGGAKLTALAGAIFHNALDKRGQGDAHQLFLEFALNEERVRRFPQTNNTRFGSHGEAAVELITHLDVYRRFMEVIRVRKVSQTFTNIEKNVSDGLNDPATLHGTRNDDTALNGVSLGPFHARVREQCELLIAEPDLVLDFDSTLYPLATLDGKTPDADGLKLLDAVKSLHETGGLPHLEEMFVEFLKGAMATWIRFSSEYAPGGVIDGLSDEMKERVARPATNDVNEGALGAYVVWARDNATGAVHTHNGLKMCQRNGTDAFADVFFTESDFTFVIKAARRLELEGLERNRRREQREYDARMLAEKEAANAKKVKQADAIRSRLDAIELIKSWEGRVGRQTTPRRRAQGLQRRRPTQSTPSLADCFLNFNGNPLYAGDTAKINYALSYCKEGPAVVWKDTIVQSMRNGTGTGSFNRGRTSRTGSSPCSKPAHVELTIQKMETLRQGKGEPAMNYFTLLDSSEPGRQMRRHQPHPASAPGSQSTHH
ncbi:hypothetical protein HMN09_01215700 [Mycena chlorophos]|uniref:Uncharacterized protein n=1 Tax=Mycena chlorophos TaxID=658473 RepID=A0A8H6S4Z6_MYCCL|nr:hypothetical protein HMN09_01215700 [Mycena chlorophos]